MRLENTSPCPYDSKLMPATAAQDSLLSAQDFVESLFQLKEQSPLLAFLNKMVDQLKKAQLDIMEYASLPEYQEKSEIQKIFHDKLTQVSAWLNELYTMTMVHYQDNITQHSDHDLMTKIIKSMQEKVEAKWFSRPNIFRDFCVSALVELKETPTNFFNNLFYKTTAMFINNLANNGANQASMVLQNRTNLPRYTEPVYFFSNSQTTLRSQMTTPDQERTPPSKKAKLEIPETPVRPVRLRGIRL